MKTMHKTIGAGLVAAVSALTVAAGPVSAAPRTVGTQISNKGAADPGFAKFRGNYYIYGTGGSNVSVFRSSKVTGRHYKRLPNAIVGGTKGLRKIWAPHVVHRGNYYFMIFTATAHGDRKHCIYYAVSDRPAGGFRIAASRNGAAKKLQCGDGLDGNGPWEAIDPTIYRTVLSNDYLVWRRGRMTSKKPALAGSFAIESARITFHGKTVHVSHKKSRLLTTQTTHAAVLEAPELIHHNNKVWLFVSRGDFRHRSYKTDVYVASSIHGKFRFSTRLMQSSDEIYGSGPGGAEVLGGPHNKVWIAWHHRVGDGKRVTNVAPVVWQHKRQNGHVVDVPVVSESVTLPVVR